MARQILLRRLTDQPRSRAELAKALAKRRVPDDVATRVLDRFTEVGLIDDAAFARSWVESRQRGRGLARGRSPHELRTKGVDRETARAGAGRDRPRRRAPRPLARWSGASCRRWPGSLPRWHGAGWWGCWPARATRPGWPWRSCRRSWRADRDARASDTGDRLGDRPDGRRRHRRRHDARGRVPGHPADRRATRFRTSRAFLAPALVVTYRDHPGDRRLTCGDARRLPMDAQLLALVLSALALLVLLGWCWPCWRCCAGCRPGSRPGRRARTRRARPRRGHDRAVRARAQGGRAGPAGRRPRAARAAAGRARVAARRRGTPARRPGRPSWPSTTRSSTADGPSWPTWSRAAGRVGARGRRCRPTRRATS